MTEACHQEVIAQAIKIAKLPLIIEMMMQQVAAGGFGQEPCAVVNALAQQVVSLHAIVGKLPKGGDGLPLVDGEEVWACVFGAVIKFTIDKRFVSKGVTWFDTGHGFNAAAAERWHTEAAANAAVKNHAKGPK